jgi:glycosyltransferase involved in cell wall biosynthesis
LCFSTVRNERHRLPFFLFHHRQLGVGHFLFVDNGSDDGTADYLSNQDDVSLWTTQHSYRLSRFGADWLAWLQIKYGHGKWCLTLDADEIFIYPYYKTRSLHALVSWLEAEEEVSFGALMLDMYPKGPIGASDVAPGADPFKALSWFDSGNYTIERQSKLHNLWIQGGVRSRCFFHHEPRKAPTLSKTPLVKWNRRFAYVSSTHSLLPRRLNEVYDRGGGEKISGILLHTKFLPSIVQKSAEDLDRKQHFENSHLYESYYKSLLDNPNLWCSESQKFTGWRQLEKSGLMSRGGWI